MRARLQRLLGRAGLVLAVAIASLAIATLITANADHWLPLVAWGAALGLAAVAWPTLRGRSLVGLVMVYGFLAFGVAAALLYHPTLREIGANPQVAQLAESTGGYQYVGTFTVAAFAVWVPFVLFASRTDGARVDAPTIVVHSSALALAAVPLILDVYGTGLGTVLDADTYLQATGPDAALKVGRALGPAGLLLAGYFIFAGRSLTLRLLAGALALGYALLYLGLATRNFGLMLPLLFVGGLLGGQWSTTQRRVGFVVALLGALVMLQIPLGLRGQPEHGLVASVTYLATQPELIVASPINNILFGAPLTLYVAHDAPSLPLRDVATSLSPAPSSLNDWPQVAPTLRVNRYTPYSALGELLNHGWLFFMVVMAAFGTVYALAERAVKRSSVSRLGLLVMIGVAALFVAQSTEYNLRTVARLTYYSVAAVLAFIAIAGLVRDRHARAARSGMPAGWLPIPMSNGRRTTPT